MLKNSLKDITILDLTNRLPGPLATSLLRSYGASVTRVEWSDFEDPFSTKEAKEVNPLFYTWYENFKRDKDTISLNRENKKELLSICSNFDVIISSLSSKINQEIYEHLGPTNKVVLNLVASKSNNKSSHDLNMVSELGLLNFVKLNTNSSSLPPFVPLAGIQFSNSIALEVLNALYLYEKTKNTIIDSISLDEACEHLKALAPKSEYEALALHNGKFPCYRIYPLATKNDFVALAAMEEHYWYNFLSAFDLEELDRFDTTGEVEQKLLEMFLELSKSEVLMRTRQGHYCLSVFSRTT